MTPTVPYIVTAGVITALASWLGVGLIRRYALGRGVIDVPNERSSHERPVPRGGGLAISILVMLAAIVTSWMPGMIGVGGIFLIGGGAAVTAAGWVDDHVGLRASLRAGVHFAAATAVVLGIGGITTLTFGNATLSLGVAGSVLSVFGVVWSINLFNFMDGIDGLAGAQALSMGLISGVLLWMAGDLPLALICLAIAASSAGFLVWNRAPARIFMGDVGSGFLGFAFGVLIIAAHNRGSLTLAVWVIAGAAFLFDATVTLLRRAFAGEQLYEAHRKHAYQRAVQSGFTHAEVTGAVLAMNVVLGGLAWLAARGAPDMTAVWVAVAYGLVGGAYVAVERRQPFRGG